MDEKKNSVLLVGFNTRPLAYSLKSAGYQVYAVDFFGDLDLYPNVKDCSIVIKKLGANYELLKESYSTFLAKFAIEMLKNHPNLNYLIIGSGLDDAFDERILIIKEIQNKNYEITNLNNNLETIRISRDIKYVYNILTELNYKVPKAISYDTIKFDRDIKQYPFIFKKKTGSGGINIYKIEKEENFIYILNLLKTRGFNPKDWLVEDFIEGIPVSCTTISNGKESKVISVNRQIIGEKYLNSPKKFMYCGNIVPANLFKSDENLIKEISMLLACKLKLKGINGFDFVLRNHYPYLMEINPRIPGSIRASESALNLNLLDLHIQCFYPNKWNDIKKRLRDSTMDGYTTKLIFFAPKEIDRNLIHKINSLKFIHDKSEPIRNILKNEPVCSVLYKAKTFPDSYFGALKIVDKIYEIID